MPHFRFVATAWFCNLVYYLLAPSARANGALDHLDVDAKWIPVTPPMVRSCIMVASTGGVGSSRLMTHLLLDGLLCNDPNDRDGLKHRLLTKEGFDLISKTFSYNVGGLLYIFDHPALVVASLYRRGYQHAQCYKLTGTCNVDTGVFKDVGAYAKQEKDVFEIGKHVRAAINFNATNFPVVVIRSSGQALRDPAILDKIAEALIPASLLPYTHLHTFVEATLRDALHRSLQNYNITMRREKYLIWPGFFKLENLYQPLWEELSAATPNGLLIKMPAVLPPAVDQARTK